MKVLNLRCSNDHRFEGWFGSTEDFESQCERALVECPLCADHAITRLPSAPRLNVSGAREEPKKQRPEGGGGAAHGHGSIGGQGQAGRSIVPTGDTRMPDEQMQAQWMQAVKHAIANSEDVGQHFADEARRMHYGETEERAIRGSTSLEEAHSLREEGIEVVALPIPPALKGTLQ